MELFPSSEEKTWMILFLPVGITKQKEIVEATIEYVADWGADYFLLMQENKEKLIWKGRRGISSRQRK